MMGSVVNQTEEKTHFQQVRRRKAEFITPPNKLREKVGYGGISEERLNQAQEIIEENAFDFREMAEGFLADLKEGIDKSYEELNGKGPEELISLMLLPAMHMKANGGMFHYPLISRISDTLVQFLEVIREPDRDSLEIVLAFYHTLMMIVRGQIQGRGNRKEEELFYTLEKACYKYFDKNPHNHTLNQKK